MRKFIPTNESNSDLLPKRSTQFAAAYDLYAAHDINIYSGDTTLVKTGVSVSMYPDEWLEIKGRSGLAIKKGIIVGAGVIDADYKEEIGVIIHHYGDEPFQVRRGDRIGQAIFQRYLVTDDDQAEGERQGGFGSTGLK